jgi:hypothetical protein
MKAFILPHAPRGNKYLLPFQTQAMINVASLVTHAFLRSIKVDFLNIAKCEVGVEVDLIVGAVMETWKMELANGLASLAVEIEESKREGRTY